MTRTLAMIFSFSEEIAGRDVSRLFGDLERLTEAGCFVAGDIAQFILDDIVAGWRVGEVERQKHHDLAIAGVALLREAGEILLPSEHLPAGGLDHEIGLETELDHAVADIPPAVADRFGVGHYLLALAERAARALRILA